MATFYTIFFHLCPALKGVLPGFWKEEGRPRALTIIGRSRFLGSYRKGSHQKSDEKQCCKISRMHISTLR